MLSVFGTPETERRFLVHADWPKTEAGQLIRQGYLPTVTGLTLRVRWTAELGTLTAKTPSLSGSRWETEWPLAPDMAKAFLGLCAHPPIEKRRYLCQHHGLTWGVDEFLGRHHGLVVAEVELQHPLQSVDLPAWVGPELTGLGAFSNSHLAKTNSLNDLKASYPGLIP